MFKKQGTSLLLSSGDNIDGTQTFQTQLSAAEETSSTGGPLLVRSPVVRFPLVRFFNAMY